MKTNTITLTGKSEELQAVLAEVGKFTSYNELDHKSSLRVQLLAEELVSMLPELLEHSNGVFWAENEGSAYELHVAVTASDSSYSTRQKLMEVSTSGKNAAVVGIMSRIRAAAEMMLYPSQEEIEASGYYDAAWMCSAGMNDWALSHYVHYISTQPASEKKEAAWDELEKSIVAKLADDVTVSIRAKKVEIVVSKKFA